MKHSFSPLLFVGLIAGTVTVVSCGDNRAGTDAGGTTQDTNLVDTRRNTGDTTNYLTKDSTNQSQDVVDPNPPQNSKY